MHSTNKALSHDLSVIILLYKMDKPSNCFGKICFVAILLGTVGSVSADQCEQYMLDCKPMKGVANSYKCSAPSPVHGDSCTTVNAPTRECSSIVGLSVTEGVVANWDGLRMTITTPPSIYCSEHEIMLNVSCADNVTLYSTITLIAPDVDIQIGKGSKFTNNISSDVLILVCNATGLGDIETDIQFYGPNNYVRSCPQPSSDAQVFQDGTTTRFQQTCKLVVTKVTQSHAGLYHCEIEPEHVASCHNLTSESINVTLQPDNGGPDSDIGLYIGPAFAVVCVIVVGACIIALTWWRCRRRNPITLIAQQETRHNGGQQQWHYGTIVAEDTGGSHPEQKERMADIDNKNNNVATQNVNSVYM